MCGETLTCNAAITSIALRETADIHRHIDESAVDLLLSNIQSGQVNRRHSEENSQLLGMGEIGMEGVLGVGWDPGEDVFIVRVRTNF